MKSYYFGVGACMDEEFMKSFCESAEFYGTGKCQNWRFKIYFKYKSKSKFIWRKTRLEFTGSIETSPHYGGGKSQIDLK